ncbi:hypothetical protein RB601_006446 [Gaeumannomyces tritici]
MDDLSGLNWSTPANGGGSKPPPMNPSNAFAYPSLRPSPSPQPSGRNTPISSQGSGAPKSLAAAAKPAQDSFSGLMNFGTAKSTANLSLREQQERLEAEKRRKEEEKRKQAQASFGDGRFFESLGQGSSRAATPVVAAVGAQNGKAKDADDDLFAAFNSTTQVDNASYFPPGSQLDKTAAVSRGPSPAAAPTQVPGLDLSKPNSWAAPGGSNGAFADDDDPFGLSELKAKAPAAVVANEEEDDLLGDLGRPVEEVRREQQARAQAKAPKRPEPEPGKPIEHSESESEDEEPRAPSNDPFDKAVCQIVDYGFTPENARRALTESGAGLNVQAAVNWLLDDAHRQAKEKSRQKQGSSSRAREDSGQSSSGRDRGSSPAWMGGDDVLGSRNSRSPARGEPDFAKTAAAIGNNLFKSANSLWKTSQKKVQQAVADFQQEGGDPNQPKWMRSAHQDMGQDGRRRADGTDEVMMLDSRSRPGRRPADESRRHPSSTGSSRNQSPAVRGASSSRNQAVPKWQQSGQPHLMDPRSRINKQEIEEQSSQAYVSPARRKKTTPQPQPEARAPPPEPEADLLFGSDAPSRPQARLPQRPTPQPSPGPGSSAGRQSNNPSPRPAQPRPAPHPARQIPPLGAAALQASTKHRLEGTGHFKRGDYAAAHASYSTSLSALPATHPLAILLLCNHALTALKTGEPRQAVDDADAAVKLIGPSRGEGETVSLDGNSGGETRDMKDLYGKALTRKAEALEQMEKWGDAGAVWQLCVESGVGGPAAIAGRQRCQKALAPKPQPKPKPASAPAAAAAAAARPRPRPAAASSSSGKDSEAVERLRAANAAAQQTDAEKFALVDKVDARVAAWRDGKRDNLRALLGSLDQVLWEGSGWKKVGLHELVVANKVKIVYMKAIAKCHPDKITQDASTEVRMIAGTVFSTLNESWDKFKAENNL